MQRLIGSTIAAALVNPTARPHPPIAYNVPPYLDTDNNDTSGSKDKGNNAAFILAIIVLRGLRRSRRGGNVTASSDLRL